MKFDEISNVFLLFDILDVLNECPLELLLYTEPTDQPTIEPTMMTDEPTDGPSMDPTQTPTKYERAGSKTTGSYQTSSTNEVDVDGLVIAAGIIGGLFVIFVIVACRLWVKHEKAYNPIFEQRKQEMMKARASSLNGNYEPNNTHTPKGQDRDVGYHEEALEMGQMHGNGASSPSPDGYVDTYDENGIGFENRMD